MKETRFKQTEIGLIPEDWEIRKLGSIFKFIPNNTISRDNLVNQGTVMNVHYGDILIKYDSILDIKNNEIPFINDSVISNSKFNEFAKDGDILIADTAEDEMVCKATELYNIENRKLVSGLHTMWIRPITEFKPKYLGYFFNSTFYHNQILPLIQGTKVCSVSKGAIKDTYISIPLENEQNKIASALTSIDNLLLSLDKLIEKKRLIKQGAMQELLTGKKRLPGFTGEWVERRLGEIGALAMCKRVFQEETSEKGDIPFYKIGTFGRKADAYISVNKYEQLKQMYRFPKKGDILISAAGTIGRSVVYDGKPAYFQDSNIIWLDHNEKQIINRFLYFIYQVIKWNTENTTIARLYNDNFNSMTIRFPLSIEEQQAIASALTRMDKEIESLEGKKAKYEQIKQGMMQQLLTGKIRLIS